MGALFSKNELPVDGRTVLITGASRGLGRSAARQLAEKGANVMIVARNEDVLREGLAHVSKGARSPETQRFHSTTADVTTVTECNRVVAECRRWNDGSPPDIVWCCSGSAHPTLFVDTPPEQLQIMMDSNYFSSAYMAHAVLQMWLCPGPGAGKADAKTDAPSAHAAKPPLARHLIFTGSFVSFYSFTGFTPYSPSKAAVRALSDSLSQEMNLYAAANPAQPRVRVHTVFPATMPTRGLEEENSVKPEVTKSLEEGDQILSPDECARRAIAGLESGEELVPTSTIIRLVMTSVMGGSIRGGFWKGLVNTLLGWIVMIVMVLIRWDMDTKVSKWGKEHGVSGTLKKEN
ncbi:NAD(P)-binding protein [Xylariaceae sp. FL0804]|nr:NAD(P)-binding protein [Xylariaceae sp. FL0804]